MDDHVEKYFTAERLESLIFIGMGIITTAIALRYLLSKNVESFYHGLSYSFLAIAVIQIFVGFSIFLRSPKDIKRVNHIISQEPQKIQSEEIPRMAVVMKNFEIYRWIEVGLIIIGLALFFFFSSGSLWKGVGLGLIIQASFMLVADLFAQHRGALYLDFLKSL